MPPKRATPSKIIGCTCVITITLTRRELSQLDALTSVAVERSNGTATRVTSERGETPLLYERADENDPETARNWQHMFRQGRRVNVPGHIYSRTTPTSCSGELVNRTR